MNRLPDNLPAHYAAIVAAALAAVDPNAAVRRALQIESAMLSVGETRYALGDVGRVLVLGAGKAATPMAQAVEALLAGKIGDGKLAGLVVTKYGHGVDAAARSEAEDAHRALRSIKVVEAAHPVPDAAGLAAGEAILRLAASASEGDLVIALLSGGGSALLEALVDGVTLAEWQAVTALLLASGASIVEVNTLRKRLSRIKGGQLARAVYPARLLTLVLSDVVGSPLDVIASGPTVPDASTWEDAWRVVTKYQLGARLPASVYRRLAAGMRGQLPETPKDGEAYFARAQTLVVGDNALATLAAAEAARALGMHAEVRTNALEGEAADVAKQLAQAAFAYQARAQAGDPASPLPACLLWGGETTVTLGTDHGMGGRNQEMAVALALALADTQGVSFVTLATDGTDGPTDAAGGFVDGSTAARARTRGVNLEAALRRHDAYAALAALGALLVTGPTRTNVNDIVLAFLTSGDNVPVAEGAVSLGAH